MADTEMIDCPFCGSDECTVEQVQKGWYSAICGNCEAEGPPSYSNKDARLAWNGRLKQYAKSAFCNETPDQSLASRSAEVEYSAPITVSSMTLRKREFLEQKGYSVVGYVMQDAKNERCTVAHGNVIWETVLGKN